MKWSLGEPVFGDIVRVRFNEELYHYGIYASDEEIIQFGVAPNRRAHIPDSEIEVLTSDIEDFLSGGFLEVGEPDLLERLKKPRPKEIVECARSKIGTRGYNILYNNCEHFANQCYLGKSFSQQADSVRELFRNMPLVDVYIARLPDEIGSGKILPKEREEEISSVTNERVRREKYYAWRLLEYGLERSLGLKIGKMEFSKTPYGKWLSPSCKFSISHSGDLLAVAISRAEVGVDVEPILPPKSDRFAYRVLTPSELSEYSSLGEKERVRFLISSWSAKEAIFKTSDRASFIPSEIDTEQKKIKTLEFTEGETNYILAVATETPERIRLYRGIDLVGR